MASAVDSRLAYARLSAVANGKPPYPQLPEAPTTPEHHVLGHDHYLSLLEQKTNALDQAGSLGRLAVAARCSPTISAAYLKRRMGKAREAGIRSIGAAAHRELLPRRCSSLAYPVYTHTH